MLVQYFLHLLYLLNKFNLPQITNEFILDKWNNDIPTMANPKVGYIKYYKLIELQPN